MHSHKIAISTKIDEKRFQSHAFDFSPICDGSPGSHFPQFPACQIMSSIEFQTIILARSQIAAKIFATPAVRCQQFPISGCGFCISFADPHNTFRLRIQIKLLSSRSHQQQNANMKRLRIQLTRPLENT